MSRPAPPAVRRGPGQRTPNPTGGPAAAEALRAAGPGVPRAGPGPLPPGNRAGRLGAEVRSARAAGPESPVGRTILADPAGPGAARPRQGNRADGPAGAGPPGEAATGRSGRHGGSGIPGATARKADSREGAALPRTGRGRRSGLRGPERGSGATEARTPARRGTGAGGAEPRGDVDVRGHDPEPVSAPVTGQPPPRTRPRTPRTGTDLHFPHHPAAENRGRISWPRNATATLRGRPPGFGWASALGGGGIGRRLRTTSSGKTAAPSVPAHARPTPPGPGRPGEPREPAEPESREPGIPGSPTKPGAGGPGPVARAPGLGVMPGRAVPGAPVDP